MVVLRVVSLRYCRRYQRLAGRCLFVAERGVEVCKFLFGPFAREPQAGCLHLWTDSSSPILVGALFHSINPALLDIRQNFLPFSNLVVREFFVLQLLPHGINLLLHIRKGKIRDTAIPDY